MSSSSIGAAVNSGPAGPTRHDLTSEAIKLQARNLAVAMGNAGLDPKAEEPVPGIARASVDDSIVAEHVQWAAGKRTS